MAPLLRRLGLRENWIKLAQREVWLLAVILFVAGSLLVFGMLADEVIEQEPIGLDRALLLALRNPADVSDPVGPVWFEEMARDITSLGSHVVLIILSTTVIGYLAFDGKRRAALLVFASIGSGMALSSSLKLVFERARPDLVPHAVEVYSASFPSGHALLSAVTFLTLGALLMRFQRLERVRAFPLIVASVLTVLVGCSRVYLGVHWPTDVLGGWCVGAAWAGLWWMIAVWLQRHRQVETQGTPSEPVTEAGRSS
jgi:undecaprenyl-diphosphatase